MKSYATKSMALLFTLIFSTSAFAETYYELLEKQFKATNGAIALSDFRDYGHPDARLCVEFTQEHPMDETNVRIGLHVRNSDGPGPGLPSMEVTKLLLTTYDSYNLQYLADATTLEVKAKELKVTQTIPEQMTVLLRKQNDLIYFKHTRTWKEITHDTATDKDVETIKTSDLFGYCYPRPVTSLVN